MQLFYQEGISEKIFYLEPDQAKHCIRVLRKKKGDIIDLIDGRGHFYQVIIKEILGKQVLVEIATTNREPKTRDYYLEIAIAPTKNIDRLEWFMEKTTEIGIDCFSPLLCTHSERKQIRTDKLNKRLISAVKQSLRATKPTLNELQDFATFTTNCHADHKYIAHCMGGPKVELPKTFAKHKAEDSYCFLIGPEGDFSPKEIALAEANGFRPVSLGVARLRTETAALHVCSAANLLLSKFYK